MKHYAYSGHLSGSCRKSTTRNMFWIQTDHMDEAAQWYPGVWFSPRKRLWKGCSLLGKWPRQCQGTLDGVENTENSPPTTPTTEPRHEGKCGIREIWVQNSALCLFGSVALDNLQNSADCQFPHPQKTKIIMPISCVEIKEERYKVFGKYPAPRRHLRNGSYLLEYYCNFIVFSLLIPHSSLVCQNLQRAFLVFFFFKENLTH